MPLTDVDILREIHSRGNTATHEELWPSIRRLILGTPGTWVIRARGMMEKGLIEAEFAGDRPTALFRSTERGRAH